MHKDLRKLERLLNEKEPNMFKVHTSLTVSYNDECDMNLTLGQLKTTGVRNVVDMISESVAKYNKDNIVNLGTVELDNVVEGEIVE